MAGLTTGTGTGDGEVRTEAGAAVVADGTTRWSLGAPDGAAGPRLAVELAPQPASRVMAAMPGSSLMVV